MTPCQLRKSCRGAGGPFRRVRRRLSVMKRRRSR